MVTQEQLEAGRAFFIYSPTTSRCSSSRPNQPPMDVVRATIKAVNDAHAEASSEATAAKRLDVAAYRQLFPGAPRARVRG